ncbi:hypothetical protein [Desulfospira joergensenii]|uniref:hypothetical protein n=1 Tax=Desulfospira joergensenii TaxID=53329 RepID=UPI0003B3DA0C|nr:hypothetical protein [Desulfospira joergensenii]
MGFLCTRLISAALIDQCRAYPASLKIRPYRYRSQKPCTISRQTLEDPFPALRIRADLKTVPCPGFRPA